MTATIEPSWAWDVYRPSAGAPWDLPKVGHLCRRAAFGASWPELEAGLKDGPQRTIDRLLHGTTSADPLAEQMEKTIVQANNGRQARSWWLYRMLYSGFPLREKLTLFWHNHFATSNAKVNNAGFMLGQYNLLHKHALGNFRTLLQEISTDPAMMVWLDTSQSKKGMPNENYARELMELFSLGIGNYTEADIREAARAFTGWEIQAGKGAFNPKQHDDGVKTVLGQKGAWKGADIVRICLEQPSAPYFIVTKLYRFLISESVPPTRELLQPLAEQFRASNYNFGAVVETMLRSNLFFAPVVYRTCIKSPVEFALGIVRGLEGHIGTSGLADRIDELGQSLFSPPSVKGWDGGPTWLNSQTLLLRQNLALDLTSTEKGPFGRRTDPAVLARKYGKQSDSEVVDFFLKLLLQGDAPPDARARLVSYQQQSHALAYPVYWTKEDGLDHRTRALCHLVLTLPEFQLN